MDSRRSAIEVAVSEMLPDANPAKAALAAAISEAAAMLEDDEPIRRLYQFRTLPTRTFGAGLILVTDRALVSVDARPPDAAHCHRLPANEIRSITVIPVGGTKFAGVAALGEHDSVQLFVGWRSNAETVVDELRDLAPGAVGADPARVVENWWDDPRIAWPRPLSLGTNWRHISGLSELPQGPTGLGVGLSRPGIAVTQSGAAGQFRIDIPWERVLAIHVEGEGQRGRRSAKRLLMDFRVPFARKESPSSGCLVVDLDDGSRAIFVSLRNTEPALRDALSTVLSAAPSEA